MSVLETASGIQSELVGQWKTEELNDSIKNVCNTLHTIQNETGSFKCHFCIDAGVSVLLKTASYLKMLKIWKSGFVWDHKDLLACGLVKYSQVQFVCWIDKWCKQTAIVDEYQYNLSGDVAIPS